MYDLVVRGGTIVDGSGLPSFRADLAVTEGRIAPISGRISGAARREIDAGGCILAPGAIDLHAITTPSSTGILNARFPDGTA